MVDPLAPLIAALHSDDWDTARSAAHQLSDYGHAALMRLYPLLSAPSILTRRATALALVDIGAAESVAPLIAAIRNPQLRATRSTFLYALRSHTCEDHFVLLFELALTGIYEEQAHAYSILMDQTFWYDLDDLARAQQQLAAYRDGGGDAELVADLQGLLDDLHAHAAADMTAMADQQEDDPNVSA